MSAPPEIWQHIFLFLHADALVSQRNDLLDNPPLSYGGVVRPPGICLRPSLPISLSHVCKSWRTLALHTPDLWSSIFLGVPRSVSNGQANPLVSDASDGGEAPSYRTPADHSAAISDAVEAYLKRSGNMPLNIILMVNDNDTFLDRLVPHSHRWQSLHVRLPTSVIVDKLRHLKVEPPSTAAKCYTSCTTRPHRGPLALLTSLRVDDQSWELSEYTSRLIEGRLIHPYASGMRHRLGEMDTEDTTNLDPSSETRLQIPFNGIYDITSILASAPSLIDVSIPTFPVASTSLSPCWTASKSLASLSIRAIPSETNAILALLTPVSQTLQTLHLDGIGITRNDLLPSESALPFLPHSDDNDQIHERDEDDRFEEPWSTNKPGPLLLPRLHTLSLKHPTGRLPLLLKLGLPALAELSFSGRASSKPELRRLCVAIRAAVLERPFAVGSGDVEFLPLSTGCAGEDTVGMDVDVGVEQQARDKFSTSRTVYLPRSSYEIVTKRLDQYLSTLSSSPTSSSSTPASSTLSSGSSTPYSSASSGSTGSSSSASSSRSSSGPPESPSPYYTLSGMFPPLEYHIDIDLNTQTRESTPNRKSPTVPQSNSLSQPLVVTDPLLESLDVKVAFDPCPYPMFASSYGESEVGGNEIGVQLIKWYLSD